MREIKFRAWDATEKTMDYSQGYVMAMVGEHGEGETHFSMQYTGLKDKNGVEIYEGDIVTDMFGDVANVHFVNGAYWLGPQQQLINVNNYIMVIGNMYENPELLND